MMGRVLIESTKKRRTIGLFLQRVSREPLSMSLMAKHF